MPIRKPPVSSSVEIEIRPPDGYSIQGNTRIGAKKKLPVEMNILLDTGKTVTTAETGLEKARERAKEYSRSGVTIVYGESKIVHYPSHRIQEISLVVKNENF